MSGSARSGVARDEEVADKGRRSFLRRAERQEEYNAEGTGCQCLFSVQFEWTWKLLKGRGLPISGCNTSTLKTPWLRPPATHPPEPITFVRT